MNLWLAIAAVVSVVEALLYHVSPLAVQ